MRILAQLRAIVRAYRRRPPLRKKKAGLALSSVWPFWLIVGFLVTVLVSAGIYSWITLPRTPSPTDVRDVALQEGLDLRIGLKQLQLGHLYFFHYAGAPNGGNRFLVQRGPDGSVTVARATCQACYSNAKDHHVSDAGLVCGKCNTPMHVPSRNDQTVARAGCDLIPLPHQIDGDQLVVKARDVTDFNLTKEKS